jgi:hypothetical protein
MYKIIGLFLIISVIGCNKSSAPTQPNSTTIVFEDHFNDSTSSSNWNHTTDYRGGGQFQVVAGQFARTQIGHVFYYNKKFSCGNGTYEFKAKGQWVFFWRGTTQDSTQGKAIEIQNNSGTLTYYEVNWTGFVYGYHNGSISRQDTAQIGQALTDNLNQFRIVDGDTSAKIYFNGQLKMDISITPSFKNTGYIEIGCNHLSNPTAFDDIIVTQ